MFHPTGTNSGGTTTTVDMLEGVTAPTGGQILYKGEPLGSRFRHKPGIIFQSTLLQDFITVRETLQMFARFYRETPPLESIGEQCSLGDFLNQDTRKLSAGQFTRIAGRCARQQSREHVFRRAHNWARSSGQT
jgi:ABC-2 type transport system ATP-binding protein